MGTLSRTAHGSRFEYERDFFEAHRGEPGGIAVHLPFARRVVETHGVNVPTYFAGLIPEGLRLKALLARTKTSEDDLFTLPEMQRSDRILSEIFAKAGAADRYRTTFYPGPHKLDREMQAEAFDWFDRWLKA